MLDDQKTIEYSTASDRRKKMSAEQKSFAEPFNTLIFVVAKYFNTGKIFLGGSAVWNNIVP